MVPEVKKCTVDKCFYWRDNECFAHSILVGSDEPVCETFAASNQHAKKPADGVIGACHVTKCEYNSGMFCHACSDIEVAWNDNKAQCITFEARQEI